MTTHHTSSLIQQAHDNCLYLVTGRRNKNAAWCYVSVPSAKHGLFQKALAGQAINVNRFGKILFSGTGNAPSEEITRIIHRYFIAGASPQLPQPGG